MLIEKVCKLIELIGGGIERPGIGGLIYRFADVFDSRSKGILLASTARCIRSFRIDGSLVFKTLLQVGQLFGGRGLIRLLAIGLLAGRFGSS